MKLILNKTVERWIEYSSKTKDCYFAKLQKEIDLVKMNYSLIHSQYNEIVIVGKSGIVFKYEISNFSINYITCVIDVVLPNDISNSSTVQEYTDYLCTLQEDGWVIVV